MALSGELSSLFDRLLTGTKGLSSDWHEDGDLPWRALLFEAMAAAGLAPPSSRGAFVRRVIFRACSLNPTQRATAEFLAQHPELPTHMHPLPGSNYMLRRWLGIDPPGALFKTREDGSTPFEIIRLTDHVRDHDDDRDVRHILVERLAWLPIRERIQALTDMCFANEDLATNSVIWNALRDAEIDDSHGSWALESAQRLLDRRALSTRNNAFLMDLQGALQPTYLALVRAGEADNARFDSLLPLSPYCALGLQCEMLSAISEERREAALLTSVNNLLFESERVRALERLLPFYPYRAVAAYILENVYESDSPSTALRAVRAAGKTNSTIETLYEAHMAKWGKVPKLQAISFTPRPARSALSQGQQRQLELLDGYAAEEPEGGPEQQLNLVVIANEEGPLLEAWLDQGNRGSIFRAGTTETVAWMGQGGPDCADKAMLTALRDALAWGPLNRLREASSEGAETGPWAVYRDECERVGQRDPSDGQDEPL